MKTSKHLLFQAANILIGLFLLIAFFIADQNIIETIPVAKIAALTNLSPEPMDYFWDLNIGQAPLDLNKLRYYTDYYEYLLQVFPDTWAAYGILGYSYHYLNDDPKAIEYLKIAIQDFPDYFLNYYNLAVIYINESRYEEADSLLQKALTLDPQVSIKRMCTSQLAYSPLLGTDNRVAFVDTVSHLKKIYRSGYALMQILSQADTRNDMHEIIRQLGLELYAF